MSTEIMCNQNKESGNLSFCDEIFQRPIATVNIDVWEIIFDRYLTSPLDRKNLLLASPQFFGPLLDEYKCSIFLGEVLHILHKSNYLLLRRSEFLEFRTLSKSCKESIDACLQFDNPCFQNLDGIDHDHNDFFTPRRHACWEDLSMARRHIMDRKIDEYAAMIGNEALVPTRSHPFIPGYLAFVSPWFNPDVKNHRVILSTIGTQIHHFRFRLFYGYNWAVDNLLCEFLGMMPNVRTIMLENYHDMEHLPKVYHPILDFSPLPSLDQLVVLKTIGTPSKIVNALVSKYGRHLKKISVNAWGGSTKSYINENGLSFAPAINLTDLSLPLITTETSIGQYLRTNVKQTSTLKCISLTIGIRQADVQRTGIFQELTSALHELFGSAKLHTLNLIIEDNPWYCSNIVTNFFVKDVRLKLPTLRRLWIRSRSVEISSIDFILGVSDSLEELVLTMVSTAPEDKGQSEIIHFAGCWNAMEKSNVWQLMPKLQKITIRNKVSREKYYQEYINIRPPIPSKTQISKSLHG